MSASFGNIVCFRNFKAGIKMRNTLLGLSLVFMIGSVSDAAIITDGMGRPSLITDFDVSGTLYDVTFHFDDLGASGDFIGGLASIVPAFTAGQFDTAATNLAAMLAALEVQPMDPVAPVVGLSPLIIHVAPIPPSNPPGAISDSFDSPSRLSWTDFGSWTAQLTDQPVGVADSLTTQLSQNDGAATFALAASSAVPEPSSFALLGMATVGGVFVYRRKRRENAVS